MKLFFLSVFLTFLLFTQIKSSGDHLSSSSSNLSSEKNQETLNSVLVSSVFFEKSANILSNTGPFYTISYSSKLKVDKKNLIFLTRYEHCSLKTGILYYLSAPPSKGKTTLNVKAIYVTLTPKGMFFSNSADNKNLFETLKTKRIIRITQQYPGTLCFDIHAHVGTEEYPIKILTVCSKTKNVLNEWINSIIEFKKCEIVQVPEYKNKQSISIINSNDYEKSKINEISYKSNTKAFRPSRHSLIQNQVMKKSMSKLFKNFKKGEIAEKKLRRIMRTKLARQIRYNKQNEVQEMTVRKLMETRQSRERENELKLIRLEHKHKELTLIKNAKRKLSQLRIQEMKETESHYRNQIMYHRQEAKKKAYDMLKILRNQKKLSDWSVCISDPLIGFRDTTFINGLCHKYYGESGGPKCMKKRFFCNKCCHFHIGVNHRNIRFQCTSRCRKIINKKLKDGKTSKKKENKNKNNNKKNRKRRNKKSKKNRRKKNGKKKTNTFDLLKLNKDTKEKKKN